MILRRDFLTGLGVLGLEAVLAAQDRSSESDELAVMTYNLRYASNTPPNSWPERRPVMKSLLDRYAPDVMGTQEGLYHQLKEIAADQPSYDWIGLGRDGGSRGEFMAIFYKRQRLEPLEFDHFWLSDTPNVVGSSTWGNSNRRMVTWVRFRDRRTQREFHFWNTHLDHQIQEAREKSAQLILERLKTLPAQTPLLLVGDFNAVARDNRVYEMLVTEGGLTDTWFAARQRRNEDVNSFNGFEPLQRQGKRIDWILVRGRWEVRASEVINFSQGNLIPSDHFPVMAWVNAG